ncbi:MULTISPECIES: DUF6716 putative glycosyltransferase [unclassified Streptomyces]|uniref:Uncharacterized protein n=1 Tax=Streptomyces evansiae TaxID=3075535 RepID=A0ABU2R5D9_9ACTN|nr:MULTISPECIES: DUF6716 putative glycosyltransferase [unclassified Streptomyces]MDT0411577.1 hypothetical protein [Streptomyces sp. DSM 41979]MYQ57267.1 hypothetical protein [Streptomyces sp. SID4926]SCD43686.1 hypothetical protein GA0115252_106210 [Streptomyces sp. DfronAA-171]
MSISKPKPPRVAVLADSDTRWKWGALTAARVTGCEEPDGFLLRGRATPTARQLREVGVRAASLREVTANGFVRAMGETEYDVVVLALVGGGVQALVHGLRYAWQEAVKRPVLVTGYVGVVYEKLADGLLLRHGADVVLANSRDDAERFRAVYEGVGADSAGVVECALPFLQGEPATGDSEGPVVFAVQPSVPERRADRLYLLRRAAQHARLHPGREVLVKLRSRPGEHTTHIEEQPYQKLARSLDLPPNCRLEYGHMGTILDTASLLVTVSSTAALEALHRGVPTAVLTDLGIREALGNHAFLGSGCLTSWDALDAGHLPKADPAWAARQGVASDRPYESAFDAARARIAALLARPQLPPLSPYYTLATAPGYLPGILARHHLAPDGSPLPGAPSEARPPGPLKQVVRQAARGAYRHGVQRVAPVIRRMGDL